MASPVKNRREAKSFTWTLEARVALLEICLDYQATHGNAHTFKWAQIVPLFIERVGVEVTTVVLCNKMDAQKREYNLWKNLRHNETGLGYNAETGQILAPAQWWDHKIKENNTYKKFRAEGVPPVVEDLWARLFEGTVATGEHCTIPEMGRAATYIDAQQRRATHSQVAGDGGLHSTGEPELMADDMDAEQGRPATIRPQHEQMGGNYGTPPPVTTPPPPSRGRDEFSPSAGPSLPARGSTPTKKRTRSGSNHERAVDQLCLVGEACKRYCSQFDDSLAQSVTSPSRPRREFSVEEALQKLYDMAQQGLLARHGELFTWAAIWLLEAPRRRLFLNYEDNDGRLSLLQHAHDNRGGV